jgi:hypothetical protein
VDVLTVKVVIVTVIHHILKRIKETGTCDLSNDVTFSKVLGYDHSYIQINSPNDKKNFWHKIIKQGAFEHIAT